jgi:glycosyltransferase involved in cell wall biosynthesis
MITYNHAEYIRDAIEGVLKQVTDFPIELIIGEDRSTDNTREICQQFAVRFPEKIILLPAEQNLGMMQNFLRTFRACSGSYMAFLEGDDYWTDSQKLQKQVDFLKLNPAYSLCFHNVLKRTIGRDIVSESPYILKLEKDNFNTEDLLRQYFTPTCSFVCVRYPDFDLPDWFQYCKSGDIPFLLLLSLKGSIRYIDEIMGVYRIHDKGVSSSSAHRGYNKIISMIYIYQNFNIYSNFRFDKKIEEAMIYEINHHFPANQKGDYPVNREKAESVYQKLKSRMSRLAREFSSLR